MQLKLNFFNKITIVTLKPNNTTDHKYDQLYANFF